MAKVPFTKLGLTKDTSVASFEWNGQTIEVKQYLPIQEKLDLIAAELMKKTTLIHEDIRNIMRTAAQSKRFWN